MNSYRGAFTVTSTIAINYLLSSIKWMPQMVLSQDYLQKGRRNVFSGKRAQKSFDIYLFHVKYSLKIYSSPCSFCISTNLIIL